MQMRSILPGFFCLVLTLLIAGFSGVANATVLTFDDLSGTGIVPNGYGGLTWNGNWTYYGTVQPPYTPESPPNRIYDFVNDAPINFSAPTVFNGAYFSGFSSAQTHFDLYLNNVLVATSSTIDPTSTPTFLSSGYSGLVNRVDVVSTEPDFFVMDDFTFGSAVPEPSTWAMMILGFLGIGVMACRRKSGSWRAA